MFALGLTGCQPGERVYPYLSRCVFDRTAAQSVERGNIPQRGLVHMSPDACTMMEGWAYFVNMPCSREH